MFSLAPVPAEDTPAGIESQNPVLKEAGILGRIAATGGLNFNINPLLGKQYGSVGRSLFVQPRQFSVQIANRTTQKANPSDPNSKLFGRWSKDVAYTASVRRRTNGEQSFNLYQHTRLTGLMNLTSDPYQALQVLRSNGTQVLDVFMEETRLLASRTDLPWVSLDDDMRSVIEAESARNVIGNIHYPEVSLGGAEILVNAYPGLFQGVTASQLLATLNIQERAHADLYPLFRLGSRELMLQRLLGNSANPEQLAELAGMLDYERLLVAYLFRSTVPAQRMLEGLQRVNERFSILNHGPLLGVAPPGYEPLRSWIWRAKPAEQKALFESLVAAYSDLKSSKLKKDTLQRLQSNLQDLHTAPTVSRKRMRVKSPEGIEAEHTAANPWHNLARQATDAAKSRQEEGMSEEEVDYRAFLKLLEERFLLLPTDTPAGATGYGLRVKVTNTLHTLLLQDTLGGSIVLLSAHRGDRAQGKVNLDAVLTQPVYQGATSFQRVLDGVQELRVVDRIRGKRPKRHDHYTWTGAITVFTQLADAIERSLRANAVKPTPAVVTHALTALLVSAKRGKRMQEQDNGSLSIRRRPIPRNFWRAAGDIRFDAEQLIWCIDGDTEPSVLAGTLGQPKPFLRQLFGAPIPEAQGFFDDQPF